MASVALEAGVAAAKQKVWRRRQLVIALRIAFGVTMLGSWELLSRTKTIDPFFFGRPSEIEQKIWNWATVGSTADTLRADIWISVQDAMLFSCTDIIARV